MKRAIIQLKKEDVRDSDQDRQRSRVGERVPRHLVKKCFQKYLLSSSSGTTILQDSGDNDGTLRQKCSLIS